jgi:ribonuclease J
VTESSKSSFYSFSKPKVYSYSKWNEKLRKYMTDKGFCFIGRMNCTTHTAMETFKDNLLIYSMWKGYLDEKHPAKDSRKIDWISKAKANTRKIIDLHTSGHATTEQIKLVCEITSAKTILPIHSENPNAFLSLGIQSNIKILQDGETIDI